MVLHKTFRALTTKVDGDQGVVEAIVAVMGNVDAGDDVIHPGAFAQTINGGGARIRVLDQHKTDSVLRVIGKPLEMREVGRAELPAELLARYPEATGGLWTRTQFLMDTPEGEGAFKRLKAGALAEWSIGYDPIRADYSEREVNGKRRTVCNLREIRLMEYSPVIWGMNPATDTLSAKEEAMPPIQPLPADGKEMTERGPVQRFGDVLQGTIHQAFTVMADSAYIRGYIDRDQRIALSGAIGRALDVLTQQMDPGIAQLECYYYPASAGAYDLMAADGPDATKVGREISAANARELLALHAALGALIDRTGIAPAADASADPDDATKSGHGPAVTPDQSPRTSEAKATPADAARDGAPPDGDLLTLIDVYLAENRLLEVA